MYTRKETLILLIKAIGYILKECLIGFGFVILLAIIALGILILVKAIDKRLER